MLNAALTLPKGSVNLCSSREAGNRCGSPLSNVGLEVTASAGLMDRQDLVGGEHMQDTNCGGSCAKSHSYLPAVVLGYFAKLPVCC